MLTGNILRKSFYIDLIKFYKRKNNFKYKYVHRRTIVLVVKLRQYGT